MLAFALCLLLLVAWLCVPERLRTRWSRDFRCPQPPARRRRRPSPRAAKARFARAQRRQRFLVVQWLRRHSR
jgi:hypothetical protein